MPTIRDIFNEKEALLDKSLNATIAGNKSRALAVIQEALFGQLALLEKGAQTHNWDADIHTLDPKTHLEATSIQKWVQNNKSTLPAPVLKNPL